MRDQSVHPALKPGEEEVQFFLNGKEVTGKKGETIINVAAREDVYIPHYCWHPALSVAGNCRLCLVEVHMPNPRADNKPMPLPKPVIACQTSIAPGMHVFTTSELAKDCQDGMMEFLLVNHPLDCPICDRGGECMLQRYSMDYGSGHARMVDQKRKFKKPQLDPLIDIERNRCIMCTRCVRFCDEVAGDHVMGVFARGSDNYIGTFGHGPVSSIFSGNVIDLCPVGCLTSKPFRFRARVWELLQTQSTGIWNASGSKVTYWTRAGRLYRTTPPSRKDHDRYAINEDTEEFIDNVTRFGSDFPWHEDRWDESRIRIGETLLPAAFTEAVAQAAEGLAEVKKQHDADAISVLVSPRATMEEGYLAGKFARAVIGTDNVDWQMNFQTAEAAEAATLAFEHADGDLDGGFDAVILLNGDFLHTVPQLAMRVKEYARLNEKPIILLGHQHDRYFGPHTELRYHVPPGATAKALRLLGQALGGDAEAKEEFAKLTQVCGDRLKKLFDVLGGEIKKGLILQNLEDMEGLYTPQEVPAALALKGALGSAWGYLPTLRDRNAIGLYTVGAQPGRLPANEEATRQAWKLAENLPATGTLSARNLVEAIEEGRVKALLCLGADALYNYPDRGRMLAALGKLDFFVVSDLFRSEITERANVFLAAASHLEKDGTYCDAEGNLARLKQAADLVGGARPEWEVLTGLATIMGSDAFPYESIEDVFKEMMSLIAPEFKGSFKSLVLAGPRNDYSVADPGGARKLSPEYNPGDYRVDGAHFRWSGKGVALADVQDSPSVPVAAENEFLVTFGEHVQGDDYHLNRASIAHLLQIPAYAEINIMDAFKLDIDDHQKAILHVGGESLAVELRVCHGPTPGTLYVPQGLKGLDKKRLSLPLSARLEALTQDDEVAVPR